MTPLWNKSAENSYILQDVDVWTSAGTQRSCDLEIRDGFLVSIKPAAAKSARLYRWAVLPSGVDTQVHMRTPGQWEKETPEAALRAAIAGGVGAVLTMPNTKPILDSVEALELGRTQVARAEDLTGVRVLWSVAATIAQKGEAVAPLEDLVKAGAVAVTDDGKGIASDAIQREIFARLAPLGVPFLQHAETLGAAGPLAPGPVTKRLGLSPYDESHEVDMVARDLELLRQLARELGDQGRQIRYHLLHTSSARSIPLVLKAKAEGLRVTAEVSPHHLYFSSDEIDESNKSFKMNPPIRSVEDRAQLRAALASGDIDWVATDHAPHEAESKAKPFAQASFGTLGLETMLPVLLDMCAKGELTEARLVEVFSKRPAEFLGIGEDFGDLKVGKKFRATVVAPREPWTVRAFAHQSLSKNTCFDGVRLTGRVLATATESGLFVAPKVST
ncbi:MAG TPA: dihydroorotase family protein [Pseudobdellovibrionaceae bacterium]|nr:dihydroorotase family protein [Pseudobdellovibrionaceae bacterium]